MAQFAIAPMDPATASPIAIAKPAAGRVARRLSRGPVSIRIRSHLLRANRLPMSRPRTSHVLSAANVAGEAITQAGLSRQHIFASCEASLNRLNTDYLDLYILHKEDPYAPLDETLETLNDLVRVGKVRYVGYSNWSAWRAAAALQMQKERGWAQFTSGQMYYSLVGRNVEHEIVPFMRAVSLSLNVWSPLAGGFLSGKYTRENLGQSDDRLSGFDFFPFDKELGFQVVEKIRTIASDHNASVAQVALGWLLSKPVVGSIILGASKLSQLEDNLGAIDVKLSGSQIAALDQLTAPPSLYPNWFNANMVDDKHKEIFGSDRAEPF